MKAIQVQEAGGPEVLVMRELPDPVPGPGEIVIRVRAVGVNPVETYRRAGARGPLPLPWIPGSDAAGVVAAIGEGVTRHAVGDRVYTDHTATGAYAEMLLCRAEQAHPLSAHASFAAGAALGVPYATAYRALFQRGGARPGETVLVHGATGGVGVGVTQMARAAGMRVIATGGSEAGRAEALRQGAHHVLDHHAQGYLAEVADLTEGRGADVIIEMLADVNLGNDLGVLAKHGRVVVVGSRGTVEITPRETMSRDADIRGLTLYNTPPADLAVIHAALVAGLETRTLSPVIDLELPLSEAPRAHEAVMAPGRKGKIVMKSEE